MNANGLRNRRLLLWGLGVITLLGLVALLWRPLAAWFTGKPVGQGATRETVATQAGNIQLEFALKPDPPRQQGNALVIEAKDANGSPIGDADVRVTYSMPAMGVMPEMKGEAMVEKPDKGRYRATFDLPMGGTWALETRIKGRSGEAEARHTFTVGTKGLTPAGMTSSGAPGTTTPGKALQPVRLPDPALAYVRAAFQAYDSVRAALAKDSTAGIAGRAQEIASALQAGTDALGDQSPDVVECLKQAAQVASRLAESKELVASRQLFSELSQYFVALAAADPRLQEGWHLFECPMEKGFNKWLQRSPALENPYMGQQMLSCGSSSEWKTAVTTPASRGHAHAEGDVSHYTCAMHPSVKQQGPGACPICGMTLTPVTRDEVEKGIILVDEVRRQRIGVTTAPVARAPMDLSIRALGRITYDETGLEDVTLKLDGYIKALKVNTTGEPVKKGDVLFTLYSPELYAAQQEYLLALNSESEANKSLARAARKRLELWGLAGWQIEQIAKQGEPIENMPFASPASGYVLEKNVVEGAAVKAGERLFRIAPLQKVWVQADVYEQDLPHVKVNQPVEVTLPYLPGKKYEGKVAYIYPSLEGATRTGRIRIELPNTELALKPDMYANVRFAVKGGVRLQIPESAVIYTGPRRLVFVDLGEGRLMPKEVKLGLQTDGAYEVLEGLQEGEKVVTSGNFLIAAESRIRSSAEHWSGGDDAK